MSDCGHPWTSEDGCWICDLEEIIDRQKATVATVTAERDTLAQEKVENEAWIHWASARIDSDRDKLHVLRAELSELRARVKATIEYLTGDHDLDTRQEVVGKALAILEGSAE